MNKDASELVPKEDAYRIGMDAFRQAVAPYVWSKAVGDRLNTTQVISLLAVSRQALAKRVSTRSLLGLPGKGTTYYPTWQFNLDTPAIRPEVAKILRIFADQEQDDDFMIASWMMTENRELDEKTPAEWLKTGLEVGRLLECAHKIARRWNS